MADRSDEPPLRLHTPGLLSKWGFRDGHVLIEHPRYDALVREAERSTGRPVDHADLLVAVVREHLLPRLRQVVELQEPFTTLHNPARAEFVDGVHVDDLDAEHRALTPDVVDVPWSAVRAVALDRAGAPAGGGPPRNGGGERR